MPKQFGGLSSLNTYSFDVAMLGRQTEKIIMHPDAMVLRIFEARYFRQYGILEAIIGHNPSYTWTSLIEFKGLLQKSIRWSIEAGNQIPIWDVPWLCNGQNLRR
jgi:hypothetical protein